MDSQGPTDVLITRPITYVIPGINYIVGVAGLKAIRPLTPLPIFAIGGISLDHVSEVMGAGANGVAVISAILKASDIRHTVSDFVVRLARPTSPSV